MAAVDAAIAGGSFEVRSNAKNIIVQSRSSNSQGISNEAIQELLGKEGVPPIEISNTTWFKVFDNWNGDNIALETGGTDAFIGVKSLPDN